MKEKEVPFETSEIEDVRIIIKAKGKNWSIVPKEGHSKELCKSMRFFGLDYVMQVHDIVSTALEDINVEKLKK